MLQSNFRTYLSILKSFFYDNFKVKCHIRFFMTLFGKCHMSTSFYRTLVFTNTFSNNVIK